MITGSLTIVYYLAYLKKLHSVNLFSPFKRNNLTHMYRLIDEICVLDMELYNRNRHGHSKVFQHLIKSALSNRTPFRFRDMFYLEPLHIIVLPQYMIIEPYHVILNPQHIVRK